MASRRTITRFVLFSSLLLVIVACSSTSYTQSATTHSTSLQAKTPTSASLQTLQQRPLHLPVVASNTSCPTSPEKRVDP